MIAVDQAKRTIQRDHAWKQAVTNDFLRGESVTALAQRCACHKLRVEQVLREAIAGLAALQQPNASAVGTNHDMSPSDAETAHSEPVLTPNEAVIA